MNNAETIDDLKSSLTKNKKDIKERVLKLAENIEEADDVEVTEDCDTIMCALEASKAKAKSKIRK